MVLEILVDKLNLEPLAGGVAGAAAGYAIIGLPGAIVGPFIGTLCGLVVKKINSGSGPLAGIADNVHRVSDCALKLVMTGGMVYINCSYFPELIELSQENCIEGPFSNVPCGCMHLTMIGSTAIMVSLMAGTGLASVKILGGPSPKQPVTQPLSVWARVKNYFGYAPPTTQDRMQKFLKDYKSRNASPQENQNLSTQQRVEQSVSAYRNKFPQK